MRAHDTCCFYESCCCGVAEALVFDDGEGREKRGSRKEGQAKRASDMESPFYNPELPSSCGSGRLKVHRTSDPHDSSFLRAELTVLALRDDYLRKRAPPVASFCPSAPHGDSGIMVDPRETARPVEGRGVG